MSDKKPKSVRRPDRTLAMSDVRKWWFQIVVGSRRFAAWCRDFYLYKTIWLEVVILLMMAMVAGFLLFRFLYADPEEISVATEKKLELDVSTLEALRLWGVVREREYAKDLRVPAVVFSP